jgi:hypothetical protein
MKYRRLLFCDIFQPTQAAYLSSLHSALLVGMLVVSGGCKNNRSTFDSDAWKSAGPEERGQMLHDLMGVDPSLDRRKLYDVGLTKKSPLYAKTKSEVLELLGPPDSVASYIYYDVGFLGETGPLEEPFNLAISFADDGMIDKVKVSD